MGQYIYIQISLSCEGQDSAWDSTFTFRFLCPLRGRNDRQVDSCGFVRNMRNSWLCPRCSLGTWLNLIKQSKVMERLNTLHNSSLIFVFVVFGEE